MPGFTLNIVEPGILDAQCWARDPQKRGKSRHRKELPLEQKESAKWLRSFSQVAALQKLCPDTTLVSTGDRESDIFELFLAATREPAGPKLLVRAEKTRNRKVEQQHLWEYMAAREVAGALKIHIPRRGSNKARNTWVEIRFAEVTLSPPQKSSFSTPVKVWAVYVTEKETEEGIKPVEWYSSRWGIEVYHRTLKSGCRIKDRQLGTADRLEACLGVDMVVAWRIYHLTMLGREIPDLPCTVFFNDVEWKALCVYVNKNPILPPQPPSLMEAIRMMAGMGGYLGRKSDGPPGTQTMWRGLQRLETAAEMYGILTGQGPSPPI